MPLNDIEVGDSDTVARAKFSAVRQAVDDLTASVSTEAVARATGDAARPTRKAATNPMRPGDAPEMYVTSLADNRDGLPTLDPANIVRNARGNAYQAAGDVVICSAYKHAVEPGRIYEVRYAYSRAVDSSDTANDAVLSGLACYDNMGVRLTGDAATVVIDDLKTLTVATGRVEVVCNVSLSPAGGAIQRQLPAATRQVVVLIQHWGVSTRTDIEIIGWKDITNDVAGGTVPDLTTVNLRLGAQESINAGHRIGVLEARANEALYVPTVAGLRADSRVGRARRISTGRYNHFPRGVRINRDTIGIIEYEGLNHGSSDDDAIFTQKQILAAGPLTLDGTEVTGGIVTFSTPVKIYFRCFGYDAGLVLTITGTIFGQVGTQVRTLNGTDRGASISADRWNSITEISPNAASREEVAIGVQEAPSSLKVSFSRNGGESFGDVYYPVDGLQTGLTQGYQGQIARCKNGNIAIFYYMNVISAPPQGRQTFRRDNDQNGAAFAWSGEALITFNGLPLDSPRPIFYTAVETMPSARMITLLQAGRYTYWATSDDDGFTWDCTVVIRTAILRTDIIQVQSATALTKQFVVKGDYTAHMLAGVKFPVVGGNALNRGIYTVASAVFAAGSTTITTVEAVPVNDVAGAAVYMAGIVGANDVTRRITLCGNHTALLTVGDRICVNSSLGGDFGGNDGWYTVASFGLNADGKNTDITTVEPLRSTSVTGRIGSSQLVEAGMARIDDRVWIAVFRQVGGGTSAGEQFVTVDGGASMSYVGRTNSTPTNVSNFLTVSRIAGRAIVGRWYHRRSGVADAMYSVCLQTADAFSLLSSARVWGAEQVVVSTTTPLLLETGATIYARSALPHRHGYPAVMMDDSSTNALVVFALETAKNKADMYAVTVRPDYSAYFGGWESIAAYELNGTVSSISIPAQLDGYSEVRVEGLVTANATGQYALRVSEDGGLTYQTLYNTQGSTGTAAGRMPCTNLSSNSGVETAFTAVVSNGNERDRATICRSHGGVNNSSTSGGMVTSQRPVAAIMTHLQLLHDGGGLMTGKVWVSGRKAAPALRSVSTYDLDSQAIFAAMTSAPSTARKILIDTTISELKDAGIWQTRDGLWVQAAHHEQAARINWITPVNTLTAVNAPTFTTDRGFRGDGVSMHLTSVFNFSTASKYKQNNNHLSVWIGGGTDVGANLAFAVGQVAGAARHFILPRTTIDAINGGTSSGGASHGAGAIGTVVGHVSVSRDGSANQLAYKGGVLVSSVASASVAPINTTLAFLRSGASYSDFTIRYGSVGSSLTAQQEAELHRIMSNYMAAVGATP